MPKDELIKAFLDFQAFQWDPTRGFRLASGLVSPYYVDCRVILSHPAPRRLVAHLAFDQLHAIDFSLIGGLELGAVPLATCISDFGFCATPSRTWRTFIVRKHSKDHGLGKLIEGSMKPGEHAVIVDDVLTTGGSVLRAAQEARTAGLRVTHALVIVDRSEGEGEKILADHDLQLLYLLTLDDLKRAAAPPS